MQLVRRIFSFFLLLAYLNVALIPQLDEVDIISETSGQQIEDVNTFSELVCVYLGFDNSPDDEDDDTQDSGQISPFMVYICPDFYSFIFQEKKQPLFNDFIIDYPIIDNLNLQNISFDIESPPPEFC